MSGNKPTALDSDLFLIDLFDLGWEKRTGSYVIVDEHPTIIETGPSPSVPYLLMGLNELGIHPHDIEYVIVTHIHLDHAGGAGLFLQECPNAKVIVHPRGAKHLINPEKLIEGARAVYGNQFDEFFHPVVPVPQDRLIIKEDSETLQIGANRVLQFFDTPGHAYHHFSIFDQQRGALFTGDTVGINYAQTSDDGLYFYLPSTSPSQFDPDAMRRSIEKIRGLNPQKIYFSHFGGTSDIGCLEQVEEWLHTFVEVGQACWEKGLTSTEVAEELLARIEQTLTKQGISTDHSVYKVIKLDLSVCAMGILDYFQRTTRK